MNERTQATMILGSLPLLMCIAFVFELYEAGQLAFGFAIAALFSVAVGTVTWRATSSLNK